MLWAGGAGPNEGEIQAALIDAGVRVEETSLSSLRDRANGRAPDLIVLGGVAGSAPQTSLAQLSAQQPAATIPVVSLAAPKDVQTRPKSRYGLVARLDKDGDPVAVGRTILKLLRGLSRRPARWRVPTAVEEIPTIAKRFAETGRQGILATPEFGALALGADGDFAPSAGFLLAALRGVEEVDLTFHERPPGRVRVLRDIEPSDGRGGLEDARILVIDTDRVRGAKLAKYLGVHGAEARPMLPTREALSAARTLDPTLVIVAAPSLAEQGCRPLWQDARLASASVLAIARDFLRSAQPVEMMGAIEAMCEPEATLLKRLRAGQPIPERIETLGAARWLKLLGWCDHILSFRVFAVSGRGRIDFVDSKIVGASFRPADPRTATIEGRAAVQSIVGLPFGRVLAGPADALARIEGVSSNRRSSVVGTLDAPSLAPREGGRRGLVAEEVVVHRGDATMGDRQQRRQKLSVPPAAGGRISTKPPPRRRPFGLSDVPVEDEDDLANADDVDTAVYTARQVKETLERVLTADSDPPLSHTAAAPTPAAAAASTVSTRPPRKGPKRTHNVLASASEGELLGVRKRRHGLELDSDPPRQLAVPPEVGRAADDDLDADLDLLAPTDLALSDPWPPADEDPSERITAVPSEPPMTDGLAEPTRDEEDDVVQRAGLDAARDQDDIETEPPPRPAPEVLSVPSSAVRSPRPPAPATRTMDRQKLWFAASVALLIGVGAYAAWELGPIRAASTETTPETTERPATRGPQRPDGPATVVSTPDERPGPEIDRPGRSHDELVRASEDAARYRDYERSETLARMALDAEPDSAAARYRLAVALSRQRRHHEAAEWAQAAHRAAPRDPAPLTLLGNLQFRSGQTREARETYRRVLEIDEDYGPAVRMMARLEGRPAPDDGPTDPEQVEPERDEPPETEPEPTETEGSPGEEEPRPGGPPGEFQIPHPDEVYPDPEDGAP